MGIIAPSQVSSEVNVNSTQDLQKSTSLHGRAFHKISDGGKVIIQSINNIAQSVLSKCIWIVSFGRYNLDSLKDLFSNQMALENKEPIASNNSPMRSAPPPPPPPPLPPENLNRTSSNRFSSAKEQELSFQSPIASENPRVAFMDFSKESIQNALKNLKPKKKANQESSS